MTPDPMILHLTRDLVTPHLTQLCEPYLIADSVTPLFDPGPSDPSHTRMTPAPRVQVSIDDSGCGGGGGGASPYLGRRPEWAGSFDSLHDQYLGNRRPSWTRSVSKNTLSSQSQGTRDITVLT